MSLIQEALRRQQEENEKSGSGAARQEPGAQTPGPSGSSPGEPADAVPQEGQPSSTGEEAPAPQDVDQAAAGEQGAKHKVWPVIIGIVLLIVLAVGAGIYLIMLSVSRISGDESSAAAGGAAPDHAQVAPSDLTPEAELKMESIPDETPAQPDLAPAEIAEAGEVQAESHLPAPEEADVAQAEPDSAPSPAPADQAVADSRTPAKVSPTPEPAVPEPEKLLPVKWPRVKLTAVLSGLGEGQNAAIINGLMVSEGGQVEGITLQGVESDGVWLKLEHETRFLRIGASL